MTMEIKKITILLCGLLKLVAFSGAARILAIFPLAAKSHFSYNEAIMKSLHSAGHDITFISPFPSEYKIENFTMIDSRLDTFVFVGQSPLHEFSNMSLSQIFNYFLQIDEQYCYDVMKLEEIQEALNSPQRLYDIMFTELNYMYHCYLPLAEKLNIPVIGTVTLFSWKLADPAIGLPNNPAIIPLEVTDFRPRMTFVERLQNIWHNLYIDYLYQNVIFNKVNQFYEAHFPDPELQFKKKISLVFYNNHASLLPRPSVPNAVEIGGIHVKPANLLPQDLQKFIDEAEHGVILFTFGSLIKASSLPIELKTQFVKAFAAIPQRVIWKFEDPIEGLSDNVLLSSWVPQRDILEHKNVKAFISHCGLSGTFEAVHTGVPVIITPLFGDQHSNAAILEELGVGIRLNLQTVTTEKVLDVINRIINDTRYYERMQELSRIFRDRPMTPQESVVYWTEYIIRHNGAPHLRVVGSDMPLYQYLMIDIIGFVTVLITATLYILFYTLKRLHVIILKTRKYLIPVEQEKKRI